MAMHSFILLDIGTHKEIQFQNLDFRYLFSREIMNDKLKCLLCPYIAPRLVRLRSHMEVTHQGLRVACNLCDHTSTDSSNLKRHIEKIHEGVRYSCDNCEKTYVVKRDLSRHIDIQHMNKEREIFTCSKCNNDLLSKESLAQHSKTHEGFHMHVTNVITKRALSKI